MWGDFCYVVVVNVQMSEWQLEQFLRQLRYLVSVHVQLLQLFELEDALGHCSQFVTANTQHSEIGQLPNAQRQRLQVVLVQIELLQLVEIAHFVGQLAYLFLLQVQLGLFCETGPVLHTCCFDDDALKFLFFFFCFFSFLFCFLLSFFLFSPHLLNLPLDRRGRK